MKKTILSLIACLLCSLAAFSQEFQLPGESAPGGVRVLCVGNSFTYVHGTDAMLREIASSQGLDIQVGKFLAGGYTFGRHLENKDSRAAVRS